MTARLVYVTDTYCVWCWPFADAVKVLLRRHPDWTLEVVPAGMLVGDRVVPVREKNAVAVAERVSKRTGAVFGDAFRAAADEGSTVLDSTVAACVIHALFAQAAPERALEIAHRVQAAWYRDGLDLHDDAVVADIARDLGLDPDRAVADRVTPETLARAEAGFARRKALPVDGYPCLILDATDGREPIRVGGAVPDADRLERAVLTALDGGTPEPEPEDD